MVNGVVTTAHMDVSGARAVGEECDNTKQCGTCKKTWKNKVRNGKNIKCNCENTCVQQKDVNIKKCEARCVSDPEDTAAEAVQLSKHGTGADYAFTNLQPSAFPVTGTDQITLSRKMKTDAISATVLASQQANGCTNNGY
jgi:hypothetical protein